MAKEVALFVTCLVENMRPKIAFDTIAVLEDAGFTVVVPGAQVCCGQPNYNGGDQAGAMDTARRVIDVFNEYEYTVVASGSCAGMLKHHYPTLLQNDLVYREKAAVFADKVFEISQFLTLNDYEPKQSLSLTATYHDACAGLRELGIKEAPRAMLSSLGVELVELDDAESCCGFGGTFCVKYPEVSNAMLGRKLDDVKARDTGMVVMGDLGCLLNIEGGFSRADNEIQAKHFIELLAEGLDHKSGEANSGS